MQERMLNQFRDVRFRTMIQQARNRGHMNMNASFSAWGGATQLYSRLKLLSSVIHGGDLRSDIALIDSDYLETRHGEGLRRFYLEMFQKIYMISLDLARFLVQAERKHFLASTWINLIDRYCYVADSTMQEHQDKRVKRGNKGPDENNDQVQVIFKTDKEYRKWITELEELMTKTTADKPLAALTAADLKKADEHAQKLWKEGESVVLWNKLKVDHLWGPSARFQIEHNSPYFRQKFRPATDD
ncbi:hypothetical protein QBC33DRAFT_550122 [Phialemonium atrogriseum]|uniref:Uncharacterized protein n=1 Tax=Phialemonium atrogriseum TaxID=1093897 RepID=A0AAJ0BSF6_9PEZI|nr:uncharacterized protein QBC33DRAFT_550122 [Phialemonium atrogriseum]KAK1763202.1 hypothetical protein QBC33DRAFT_550122 [Phialemonium atrogriseum]